MQITGNFYNLKPVYQYKSLHSEIKADDIKQGIISGYFSAFNIEDAYGDTVMPGAFTKTISEQGPNSAQPRIKYLLNHDVSLPIGKLLSLEEDSFGLKYSAQLGTNAAAQDFIKMVESGLITEHSIGYRPMKSIDKEGYAKRDLLEVQLFEGSALSGWGVNQHTPLLGIKSEEFIEAEQVRIKKLQKFCSESGATEELIESLMLEIKQRSQLIIDLKEQATKPLQSTQPVARKVDWAYIVKSHLQL